jgi:hypothetical protein
MTQKFVFSFLLGIVALWLSHAIVSWIVGSLSGNTYLNEAIQYFYPPLFSLALSMYFFISNKKEIAYGIIIAGVLYYLILWFLILATASEMGCTRYFFNLFTNCP